MKSWNWRRWACLIGGAALAGLSTVVPAVAMVGVPLSKALLAAGGFGVGVATLTPGHGPKNTLFPAEETTPNDRPPK